MAKQVINIGAAPNDNTGDTLRTAMTKTNDNFTELYEGKSSLAGPGSSQAFSVGALSATTGNFTGGVLIGRTTNEPGYSFIVSKTTASNTTANTTLGISCSRVAGSITNPKQLRVDFIGYNDTIKGRIECTDTSASQYTSPMTFSTENTTGVITEAMRVSNIQNVLINTPTDDAINKLQVNGTMRATDYKVASGGGFNHNTDGVGKSLSVGYGSNGQTNFGIVYIGDGKAGWMAKFDGATKSLLLNTITDDGSGAKLQVAGSISATSGIKVGNSANVDATVLDWYEEGTWTPTLVGTTTAGVATTSVNTGRFTRIGRLVYFNCRIVWSAHTGTGGMRITGLPFTSGAVFSTCAIYTGGVVIGTGKLPSALVDSSATTISLYAADQAGGATSVLAMDTAGELIITGHYEV